MNIVTGVGVGASVLLAIAAFLTARTSGQQRRDAKKATEVALHLQALEARIELLEESNARFVAAHGICRENNRVLIGAMRSNGVPIPELRFDDTY